MVAVALMHLPMFLEEQLCSSLCRALARTSVNQNRFWGLLESHWACQIDQKNHRMFETSNSKSSTHLYAENYHNRTEPTASYYTPTPSISLPCCFDFQARKPAILTGEIDAINLLNHNVKITLWKAYLQPTVRFIAPIPRNPAENGVPLCNYIDGM